MKSDELIKKAYAKAREVYPDIDVKYEVFKKRIRKTEKDPAKIHLTDLFFAISLSEAYPPAMELFYRTYGSYIKHISLKVVRNEDQAEEILHDFISELPERICKYKGIGGLKGWLGAIISNYSIDQLRKIRWNKPEPERMPDTEAHHYDDYPDVEICNDIIRDILSKSIGKVTLEDDLKLLISHKYIDDLTNREIANIILKTGEHNVSRWLKKALKLMKKQIMRTLNASGSAVKTTFFECYELFKNYPDFFEFRAVFNPILKKQKEEWLNQTKKTERK